MCVEILCQWPDALAAALQMLGCIPRTPSPESEDEDNATDSQTEIQQLRVSGR